jgi:cobyrinic acid a,c-diamide synthase
MGVIVAGTNSGCGKTTITIGLMALLKSLGKRVAPFKAGPDFIDPRFHEKVTDAPSYNIDTFIMSPNTVKALYNKHSLDADISIVEGVMGMYDGMGDSARGSAYELSNVLDLPVILTVNCKGMYQSVVALVKGFVEYKPNSNIKAVILNQVANDTQYLFLKNIIERECGVVCVGYLPPVKHLELESRHLGLVQAQEIVDLNDKIASLLDVMKNTIDVDLLCQISDNIAIENIKTEFDSISKNELKGVSIAVAYDSAFSFYYKDNFQLLRQCGAELYFFSPLCDSVVPPQCNAMYLGGGYPEVFAQQLSDNKHLLQNINTLAENGMPIFAECGGMMYLTSYIESVEHEMFPMVGFFNCSSLMTSSLKRFGYANVEYKGAVSRCHEFHRSELVENMDNKNYSFNYKLSKPDNSKKWECGLSRKNVLGGYAHLHFMSEKKFTLEIFNLWKKAIM